MTSPLSHRTSEPTYYFAYWRILPLHFLISTQVLRRFFYSFWQQEHQKHQRQINYGLKNSFLCSWTSMFCLLFMFCFSWKQICTLTKVNRIKEDWIVKKFISTPCRFSKSQYNLRTNLKAISLSFLTNRLIFIYVLSPVRFYWCKNLPPVGTKKQIRGQKLLEGFGTC